MGGSVAPQPSAGARYDPLLIVLGAQVLGILADHYHYVGRGGWVLLGSFGLLGWCVCWLRGRGRVAAACLLLSLSCQAAIWHDFQWRRFAADEISLLTTVADAPLCCEGVIVSPPQRRGQVPSTAINPVPQPEVSWSRLQLTRVRAGSVWRNASGLADLVVADGSFSAEPGTLVRLVGRISGVRTPPNPGEFDFANACRLQRRMRRIHVAGPAAVRSLRPPSGSSLRWLLPRIRQQGCAALRKFMPAENAELASGILLGARAGIPPETSHQFLLTGTVHLLAISGLHVGILSGAVWMLGRCGLLSRRWTLACVVLFVFLYALLTEAQPPIVRAGALIGILSAAKFSGRRTTAANALAAAGVVVLVINPCHLFRLGTQFSFLAVATLIAVAAQRQQDGAADPLDRLLSRSRPLPVRLARRCAARVWQLFTATAWIWSTAAPLVAFRFHLLTPVALVINPLVALPIAGALFSGFGVLVLAGWCPPAAALSGTVCDGCLSICCRLIDLAARSPAGHLWVPAPPLWWVAGFYAGLVLWITLLRDHCRKTTVMLLLAAWLMAAVVCCGERRRAAPADSTLAATFVAVGHGTSVVLELPDGAVWLYDAGRLGNPETAVRRISAALWHRGVIQLDAVFLSHADVDHYNAIPGLLDRFPVRTVYVTPTMFGSSSSALGQLSESLRDDQVPLHWLRRGDRLDVAGGVSVRVLHPTSEGAGGSDNADSLVLLVEYAGRSLLLPGDLEPPGTSQLLDGRKVDCDVLMAPHHGSLRSGPAEFLDWADPQWVVISGGDWAASAPAIAEYRSGGSEVLHTDLAGAVRVELSKRGVRVRSWRSERW